MDPMTLSALINAGSNVLGRAMTPTPAGPAVSGGSGASYVMPSTGAFSVSTGSGSANTTASGPSAQGGCTCGGVSGINPTVILIGVVLWLVMSK